MAAVTELATAVGTRAACRALFASRASHYRQRRASIRSANTKPRPVPPRSLAPAERETVLAHLHGKRFQDRSPAAVYATLLDEGEYLLAHSSDYRFVDGGASPANAAISSLIRLNKKPELLATAPNSALELGHYQAAGARQVDTTFIFMNLDASSWRCHRLDGSDARKRRAGQAADRGKLREAKYPARTTHIACRSRHFHEVETSGLLAGRLGSRKRTAAHVLDDNPVFGKPIPNPKVSAGVPGPLWVHPGQSRFLSEFFSVVQRRAPSLWRRLVDASDGSLWPSGKRTTATPGCTRCCLPTSPGALRTKRSQTTGSSQRSLD